MTPARLREIALGATPREWAEADWDQADRYASRWETDRPARALLFAAGTGITVLLTVVTNYGRF